MSTVILGSNAVTQCSPVLLIAGKEAFRLRQPDGEGHLVADLHCCDPSGAPLARVVRNALIDSAEGVTVRQDPRWLEVLDGQGRSLARVEQVTQDSIRLSGTFGVPGTVVEVDQDALRLPAGGLIRQCTLLGNGTAIEVQPTGAIAFGRVVAPARPGFRITSEVRALPQKQRRPK